MNAVDLSIQIKRREDGRGTIIKQHFRRVFCENHFKERGHALPRGLVVNNNVADGFINHFANSAQQNIAFGVQLRGRANRVDALGHGLPQALQVRGVALQFGATAIKASGAKNKSKALGQFKRVQNLAHLAALLLVLNLAADANLVHVRHHHQQTARHAYITGERWTLGANALLDHLHGDLLTLLHAILNGWSIVARNFVANAFGLTAAWKIFWMQITDVQESVLAFTKINESGLNCGLHIGDAALVNVAHIGGAGHALGEVRLKSATAHKGHATFVAGNFIHNHNGVARFRRFTALHNSSNRFCWRAIGGDILGGALNIVASLGGFNYFCAFFKRVAFRGDVIGFFNLLNFFTLFKRVIAVDFRVVR